MLPKVPRTNLPQVQYEFPADVAKDISGGFDPYIDADPYAPTNSAQEWGANAALVGSLALGGKNPVSAASRVSGKVDNLAKAAEKAAKDAKKLGNSKADDLAREKGFKNAHDLKKQNLKGQRDTTMSHYNMYYNSKTKELFLKHESTGKFIKVD